MENGGNLSDVFDWGGFGGFCGAVESEVGDIIKIRIKFYVNVEPANKISSEINCRSTMKHPELLATT